MIQQKYEKRTQTGNSQTEEINLSIKTREENYHSKETKVYNFIQSNWQWLGLVICEKQEPAHFAKEH